MNSRPAVPSVRNASRWVAVTRLFAARSWYELEQIEPPKPPRSPIKSGTSGRFGLDATPSKNLAKHHLWHIRGESSCVTPLVLATCDHAAESQILRIRTTGHAMTNRRPGRELTLEGAREIAARWERQQDEWREQADPNSWIIVSQHTTGTWMSATWCASGKPA